MGRLAISEDLRTVVSPLHEETARVRGLLRACRDDAVDAGWLRERVQSVRELVTQRRFEEALRRIQELRVGVLAQNFLRETHSLALPGAIESLSAPEAPSEETWAALNRAPSSEIRVPKRGTDGGPS
jgi:hypothetical protein